MSVVTIENVGRVERLEIPLPEGGGVVELRGRNGRGKTTTLNAITQAVHKNGSVSVRDGADQARVEIAGVKLTVAKRSSLKGELEVEHLESPVDVATLADPRIDDPVRADAARIKAFVRLLALEPDLSLFATLIPGHETDAELALKTLKGLLSNQTIDAADLVEMAAGIKKDLQAEARESETVAEREAGSAAALLKSIEGISLTAPHDVGTIQERLEAAIIAKTRIAERCRQAAEQSEAAAGAQESLEKAKSAYTGRTPEAIEKELAREYEAISINRRLLQEACAKAANLELVIKEHQDRLGALQNETEAAKSHADSMNAWAATILKAESVSMPSDEEILQSEREVETVRTALNKAESVRKAKQEKIRADRHAEDAKKARELAENHRRAASQTEQILSEVVVKAGTRLSVKDGRMVYPTGRGDHTLFAELSEGERYTIAIQLATRVVGENGLLVLPQEHWSAIDEPTRQMIADACRQEHVTILTARHTADEELTAAVV